MWVRAILVTALTVTIGASGSGVAHASPDCTVSMGGALWCEDPETGQVTQEAPYGTYEYCDQPTANEDLCPNRQSSGGY
jgi:hypothetical protein